MRRLLLLKQFLLACIAEIIVANINNINIKVSIPSLLMTCDKMGDRSQIKS